jgi:hypothetical protein
MNSRSSQQLDRRANYINPSHELCNRLDASTLSSREAWNFLGLELCDTHS